MDSPTAADRARKMEMRQEAAAVAAATAAAAAVVSQAYNSGKEDGHTRAQDTANTMMTLAAGGPPTTSAGGGASPSAASPSTPVGRGKGKGRASHLGPTHGIGKSRRVATESPVGVLSVASSASASPSASGLAPRLAPRPPTYPPVVLPPVLDGAMNPYASLISGSPLYATQVAPRARVAPRNARSSGPSNVGPAPSLASKVPASPLGTKTATAAGFVVRTTPAVYQSTEGPLPVTPRNGAITPASPVVTGIRRRGHRIPAARLARQLERAGATAAAKRLTAVPSDGSSNGAPATPSSPATEAGLFTRLPSKVGLPGAADGVPAGVVTRAEALEDADGTGMVVDVGTGNNNDAGADNDNTAAEQTPFLGMAGRSRAANGGDSPKTVAPSVAGSSSGVSTPGVSDIDSAPQSPAPTRPLTWRPRRSIPSPTIEYPLSTASPSTPADESAVASLGPSAAKASKVVENAVRASTANLRVDLAALCARTNDTAARMLQLATKVDTCANLSQQTLVAVRKVEAAVKVAVADVAKQGALPAKVDANAAEELGEKLLDEVKKVYRDVLTNEFATAVETVAVFSNCDDNWDTVIDATESCMKLGRAKAEAWLNEFMRRASRRNSSIYVNVRISMLVLRVKPHLHQTWTDLIINTYFSALGLDSKNLEEQTAKQLLDNSAYYMSSRGRSAILDALAALFLAVGARSRITEPKTPTDGRTIRATLGHCAFVSTKVRNVLELAAGQRTSSRSGAIGDGHFPMWVAEVRRMDASFPTSGEVDNGLQLIDGGSLERHLPQY